MSKAVRKTGGLPVKKPKNNKNIIQKMVFPCPYRLLDTIFNILIFNMEGFTPQSQNRANVMPVHCLFCSLRDPTVNSTDKWKIQISRKARSYEMAA